MNVLVVFYSMTGNVFRLAQEVAEGAKEAGAHVRLRQVKELIPEELIDQNVHLKRGKELMKEIGFATNDDLIWADGVCFGGPTRFGNMAAQLKNFIDQTGELWAANKLEGKVGGCFTSSGTQHGGQESTLLSMMIPLFHLGFVIQGLPYSVTEQKDMDEIHGGSPYGVSSVSDVNGNRLPTEDDLAMARALGRKVAETAGMLAGGRAGARKAG